MGIQPKMLDPDLESMIPDPSDVDGDETEKKYWITIIQLYTEQVVPTVYVRYMQYSRY